MLKEQVFISDQMDRTGLKEGDEIILDPFWGRRRSFTLNRTCIDFVTEGLNSKIDANFIKKIDSIGSEQLHLQLKLCETTGTNQASKKRYIIQALRGGPVKLNGNYVLSAYVECGDTCEIGHNKITFRKCKVESNFDLQDQLLSANKELIESSLPILIEGETGVGKTSLAEKIHKKSKKRGRFIHLNLSSFSQNLIESELFGHTKGAFTGAIHDKLGAFREANGGTLFLDEIDSLSIENQTKLLLFLDSFKARPVGGNQDYNVDTRILCASGKSLFKMVDSGLMRMDFYFRISNGHTFKLDSLRNNLSLIEEFCHSYSLRENVLIGPKLIDFFKTLPWPGNFRQLKGHLEKKRILSSSRKLDFDILDEKLIEQSSELATISQEFLKVSTLKEIKKAYALKIYFKCNRNLTLAAKQLSVSVRTVKLILQEHL